MDIKPVKKRRQRTPIKPSNSRKSIQLKSKINLPGGLKSKPSGKSNKFVAFISRNLQLVAFSIFLVVLYLPSSKLLDTHTLYQDLVKQSLSVDAILNHSSYLPQKFLLFAVESGSLNGRLIFELLNFVLIILTVYLFYVICLKWLGKSTALIATLLFSTSSWMILSSQSLSFNSIYLIFIPLVIYMNYLLSGQKNVLKVFAGALVLAAVFYSPGMVWPVLGIIVLLPAFMQTILTKYNLANIWILVVSLFVLILPLLASFALNPNNFSTILTGEGSISIQTLSQNMQNSLEAMFISGLPASDLWLFGTPVFNYLVSFLALFGLIFLWTEKKFRDQFEFLIVCLVFSLITLAFVGLPALSLLVPVFYLIAGFGIKFLLNHWYALFPSNPVARNAGLALVIFAVLLSSAYEITRYYIAWPKSNDLVHLLDSEKDVKFVKL